MGVMGFMEAMSAGSIPVVAAFFIGLMTAMSPCPLTTNIIAIAYISKRISDSRQTLAVGLVYTLGRMFTYTTLASLIVWLGMNTPGLSFFLQRYGEKTLGPLLIIVGLVMLEVIRLKLPQMGRRMHRLEERLASKGYAGGFLLGMLFALAFCPFSAVLFFGMLIPLALRAGDALLMPSVFAFATGLPVIVFSFLLAFSISRLAIVVNKVQIAERWARKAAALIFVCVGAYYTIAMWL